MTRVLHVTHAHTHACLTRTHTHIRVCHTSPRILAVSPGPVDTGRLETMLKKRATLPEWGGQEDKWQGLLQRFPGGRAATSREVRDVVVWRVSCTQALAHAHTHTHTTSTHPHAHTHTNTASTHTHAGCRCHRVLVLGPRRLLQRLQRVHRRRHHQQKLGGMRQGQGGWREGVVV